LDLGQKSMCKAPVTSVVKGLIYAGFKRVLVSWPEVGPQSRVQSRDYRLGQVGVLVLNSPHFSALQSRIEILEEWGHP